MAPLTPLEFDRVDIRVGTIVAADDFPEARKPAYRLTIDFGEPLGTKRSSVQITGLYRREDLVGRQVLAVVNFPPKRIAGFLERSADARRERRRRERGARRRRAPGAERSAPVLTMRITIQLCTYNRANLLGRVLDGCFEQTLPGDQYEIVLVNDGSRDETPAVIDAAERRATCGFTVINQANAGLARGRNAGIARSRGERIIFIDDDILPTPTFVEEHLRSHVRTPEAVVRGAVINTESFDVLPPPIWTLCELQRELFLDEQRLGRARDARPCRAFHRRLPRIRLGRYRARLALAELRGARHFQQGRARVPSQAAAARGERRGDAAPSARAGADRRAVARAASALARRPRDPTTIRCSGRCTAPRARSACRRGSSARSAIAAPIARSPGARTRGRAHARARDVLRGARTGQSRPLGDERRPDRAWTGSAISSSRRLRSPRPAARGRRRGSRSSAAPTTRS